VDTKVIQGLPLGTMVEALHQQRQGLFEGVVLVIAPGLSQGMASVVTLQIYLPAPALDLEMGGLEVFEV